MKKWKIIKGTEADFKNAADSVTVLIQVSTSKYFADKFELGSPFMTNTLGAEEYPHGFLQGIYHYGRVIAERVEIEEEMAITKGWLVNGKFTEDNQYANWASKHGYEVIAIKDETKAPDILDIILRGSLEARPRPVRQVLKHLNEEVGEVADALLAIADGAVPDELVEGEVADVILCAVDLLFIHVKAQADGVLTYTQVVEETKYLIEEAVKRKTQKWVAKSQAGEYD